MSEAQPSDPNPMPEFNLGMYDRMRDLAYDGIKKVIGLCSYFPEKGYRGDHERGAAAMLDAALCPDEVEPAVTGWNAQGRFVDEHGEEW